MGQINLRISVVGRRRTEIKKGRFSDEQAIGVLKQHEAARKVPDLAREIGVGEATMYAWKLKYGGMEVSQAQRVRRLEEEDRCLKRLSGERIKQ